MKEEAQSGSKECADDFPQNFSAIASAISEFGTYFNRRIPWQTISLSILMASNRSLDC